MGALLRYLPRNLDLAHVLSLLCLTHSTGRHRFGQMWLGLKPLHQRVLLRAYPEFAFELARRRERRTLETLLSADPQVLEVLGCLQHQTTGEDLFLWTCRQRGLTHRIVESML